MKANGQDLIFVTVELTDENGVMQPNSNNRMTFKMEGEGTIAGVGNADIEDPDSYVGNTLKAWKGRALVVIKSNHQAGEIKLSVSSNGLEGKSIVIKSIQN